ncbi:uncharacterized protein LOC113359400 [Papaver somniferum]|uniref:uncharacterized protein LOC113359400 n=1 Tax=Papaver somniferum TaxID=3469 RepID=UPI000E6FA3F3|nr:uncharacterized protein LOC113359400 [Papaver somniferum]
MNVIPEILINRDRYIVDSNPPASEIKAAVYELDHDSFPGPDGFGGWFYMKCWGIIGSDVILLEKVKNAKKPQQFRPICLANFFFKIFTKIIAMRLSIILSKIISPQQGGFIKGKSIQEQIALASEMVNEIDISRRGGNVAMKIDITQAFDTIRWEFLFEVLRKSGFSASFITWLETLFTSARISVLVNGGPAGYFSTSRGLRQGDPLSPVLFIIAEDVLSRALIKMVKDNKLVPTVNRNGICPTHIFFEDDMFLFYNGDKRNIKRLMKTLNEYQEASGQIISSTKSKCFVGGTTNIIKEVIAEECHMKLSTFPEKYLGVMLFPGRVKSSHVWGIVEQLQSYLAGWKVHELPVVDGSTDKLIWSVSNSASVHPTVKGAIWKLASNICATDDNLKKKGVQITSRCYICKKEEESLDHLLWNCDFSTNLWLWMRNVFNFRNPSSFHDILGLAKYKSSVILELWIAFVLLILREIWFFRNNLIFEEEVDSLNKTKQKIIFLTDEGEFILKGCMKNEDYDLQILSFIGLKYRKTYSAKVMEVHFTLPNPPTILICCDGASKRNPGMVGYGFVARKGMEFLVAVAGGIGVATNYYAEVMAIICAGEWAVQNNHLQICFRSDSKAAILAFSNNKIPWFVITRWNKVCAKLHNFVFENSYREINTCADNLAKEGSGLDKNCIKVYAESSTLSLESPHQAYYRFY